METHKLFISYSRSDEALVEPLSKVLAIRGAVFRDVESIKPGDEWERRLESELRGAEAVILLWCCHAASRPWIERELRWAEAWKKRMIPVLLCALPLPEYARRFQSIDCRAFGHACAHNMDVPKTAQVTCGLHSFDGESVEVAWRDLVQRYRRGLVIRVDELLALAGVAALLWVASGAVVNSSPPYPLWLFLAAAGSVEILAGWRRWRLLADARRTWRRTPLPSKLLVMAVESQLRPPPTVSDPGGAPVAPKQADASSAGGDGCGGCVVIVILTILGILALLALLGGGGGLVGPRL